ncbi:ABC transporter substrate-binding protein [Modestobacter sp. NPDC049651]|uniref:ABC transporter substrate-binding protein n=1 Tax=unclassified Modestobacter TaxID=2643866 RepID=UPI0033F56E1B
MKHRTRTALAVAGCAALLAACSTQAPESSSGSGGGADDVRTGNGVTDDTINVGILTDLSGPFAVSAPLHVTQIQAYWDQVNKDGGVCGRDVKVQVQDHQYDPQRAVALYRSMAPNVAALQQVLGSPVVAALLPLAQEDDLYVGGMGWSSVALKYPNAQIPGSTYSIESANGIDYLVDELGLKKGDKVGVVYYEGDLGGDSLAGAEYAAKQRGLEIVPQQITPRDTDLSAQASALKQAGVSAVILGAAPAQLASLAGVLVSQGLDVPLLGNSPTYAPSLLQGPSGPAILKNFYFLSSIAPYSGDEPGVKEAAALHEAAAPDKPKGWEIPAGSAEALLLKTAMDNACKDGDLTPAGIVAGIKKTKDLDTKGIISAPLDYSKEGQPATRSIYLLRPDAQAPGGLRMEATLEGPSAKSYTFGG